MDSEKKEIFRPQIEKVGEPRFPILRFRRDRIVIEDEETTVPWADVATEARLGIKNDNWWKRGEEAAAAAAAVSMAAAAAQQLQAEDAAQIKEDIDKIGADNNEAFDEDFFGEFEEEEADDEGGSYE